MNYQIHIAKNGVVEYKNSENTTVISDRYESIKVYKRDIDTIRTAIKMAEARFGTSNLEIRNTSQEDLKIIQDIMNERDSKSMNIKVINAKADVKQR